MSKELKVDLSLLREYVEELELAIANSDEMRDAEVENYKNKSLIELSKAAGLASGIMQEASLLILDIYAIVRSMQPAANVDEDLINKVLSTANKGTGNTGSMN